MYTCYFDSLQFHASTQWPTSPIVGNEDWNRHSLPPTCCTTLLAAIKAGPVQVFTEIEIDTQIMTIFSDHIH
jgi:hypothetical protein